MKISIVLSLFLACASIAPAFAIPPTAASIEPYTREANFRRIKLSPDGKYLALTVPIDDHTSLVVLDAATLKQVSVFAMAGKTNVESFWWTDPKRLLVSMSENYGSLDAPISTGELYVVSADGKDQDMIFGYRAASGQTGTHIKSDRRENAYADVIDVPPDDPGHVLIEVTPWTNTGTDEAISTVERMDVRSGHRINLGTLPLRRASVMADNHGHARFSLGYASDGLSRLYYRESDEAAWTLINDESVTKRFIYPMDFSADDSIAYLSASEPKGPSSLQRFDVATRTMSLLLQDKVADPIELLYADGTERNPIGVIYEDDKPRVTYFDPDSDAARSHRSLLASFDGEFVEPISSTADGDGELMLVRSDRNSGDIFRFDKSAKKAALLISRYDWLDPKLMAERRPFTFKARDGLELHGYLTIPHGSDGKSMPMVVYPHGGPFGILDNWFFDSGAQMMAAHGYAVLQVNFRGSGGRGRDFEAAGFQQWGGTMQDDLTDATHWAIDSGVADKNRICIYGASYGGYAALMGAIKEPTLYRCAAGYVGVYDLDLMYKAGDTQQTERDRNMLKLRLGTQNLAAVSPAKLVDKIKIPVFLAAGGKDERAPPIHTRTMEAQLKMAGKPVQVLVFPDEGHGFYDRKHVAEFDMQLLEFFDKYIGSGAASGGAG